MPAFIGRQRERVRLVARALTPSGESERGIIARSLWRRMGGRVEPAPVARPAAGSDVEEAYGRWIAQHDELQPHDRDAIRRHAAAVELPSLLVASCFDALSQGLAEARLEQLQRQLLGCRTALFCFSDDCSPDIVRRLEARVAGDAGYVVLRAPLDEAARRVVGGLDGSGCVVAASGGAVLREHALYSFAVAAAANPAARLIYSDEDRLTAEGGRFAPWFKPRFSPELLRHAAYLGPCVLLRDEGRDPSALVDRWLGDGTCRPPSDLASGLPADSVVHIPAILYHDALDRPASPTAAALPEPAESELPTVSIIIPNKDRVDLLQPCLASIEAKTDYPVSRREIIVVDNGSTDGETLRFLAAAEAARRIRVLRVPPPFNYSRMNNLAAAEAAGDVLLFLNNDTLVNRPDWLRRLTGFAQQRDVGAVGAKLLYPDGTVQHGGMIIGIEGVAKHAHVGLGAEAGGYRNLANLTREVSAVTGACLAMRRSVFREIGGFDESLAVAFNDVLLCQAATARGRRNIFVAEPLVIHREAATRGRDDTPVKIAQFQREAEYARGHSAVPFADDPYYSPNLSLERAYDLAWPPRTTKPWASFVR